MSESQPSARQMLESNLNLIRDVIRHVARRHRLRAEEAEEFLLCLAEDGGGRLSDLSRLPR